MKYQLNQEVKIFVSKINAFNQAETEEIKGEIIEVLKDGYLIDTPNGKIKRTDNTIIH